MADESIADLIYRARERDYEPEFRGHLGASQIGHTCDRYLWLSFRWAGGFSTPDGRTLRIFERGKLEEERVIKDLFAIGCTVICFGDESEQSKIEILPHFGGSLDGIIWNVPNHLGNDKMVLEIKTHNLKSFSRLESGIPTQHIDQCMVYMHGTGYRKALYVAVCKDNEQIHAEVLQYNKGLAEHLVERARGIIEDDMMPAGFQKESFPCRWCGFKAFCHGGAEVRKSCRTCEHIRFGKDVSCNHFLEKLSLGQQREGCHDWVENSTLTKRDQAPVHRWAFGDE